MFLLKSAGHAQAGLMRPYWSRAELTRESPRDWLFLPLEAKQMRDHLVRLVR
jgi:hypothetical protein